jgi:hypothetical protein
MLTRDIQSSRRRNAIAAAALCCRSMRELPTSLIAVISAARMYFFFTCSELSTCDTCSNASAFNPAESLAPSERARCREILRQNAGTEFSAALLVSCAHACRHACCRRLLRRGRVSRWRETRPPCCCRVYEYECSPLRLCCAYSIVGPWRPEDRFLMVSGGNLHNSSPSALSACKRARAHMVHRHLLLQSEARARRACAVAPQHATYWRPP